MRFLLTLLFFSGVLAAAPISELAMKDGRTLKNVEIVSYNATVVVAKWDGGRGFLKYEDFPDDWQPKLAAARPKPAATPPAPIATAPALPKAATATPSKENAARTISGQVFITTQGAGAYKFAGSNVRVYSMERFDELSRSQSQNLPLAYRRMDHNEKAGAEIDAWTNALANEPLVAGTQTDADGNFTLSVPTSGSYFIFAGGFRVVPATVRTYRLNMATTINEWDLWIMPIPLTNEPLLLNSSNKWSQPQ